MQQGNGMTKDGLKKYEKYARLVIKEKEINEDSASLVEITKALNDSHERTYHAVALDLDGTIKKGEANNIPSDILEPITRIINSGPYVLFLTGSGRSTVEEILNQVKNNLPKSQNIYRKVRAIDGNGCRLFFINPSGDIKNIPIREPLKERMNSYNYNKFLEDIKNHLETDFQIQEKECGIRLISRDNSDYKELKKIVSRWYKEKKLKYKRMGVSIVSSQWGDKLTFDISHTDKDFALAWFYTEFDFIDVPILRIGDQGKENGNDYSFLDSPYGFSVGSLSRKLTKCFPIYNFERDEILKGLEGTHYILNNFKWSPRLTIPSSSVSEYSNEYTQVCDRLRIEAERNISNMLKLWSKRAKSFFPKEIIRTSVRMEFSNIFDHKSGGIRLTDKEWNSREMFFSERDTLRDFFAETDQDSICDGKYPALIRSLFTDTGIMLRGPRYYIGLSEKPSIKLAKIVINEHCKMSELIIKSNSIQNIIEMPLISSKFTAWKMNLALLDNFRNNSLLLYNMLFQAASLNTSSRPYWKRLLKRFENYVSAVIAIYYSLLMVDVERYTSAIDHLRKSMYVFYDLMYNIELLYNFLENNGIKSDKIIRKWREVDHPGQIFAAINSISREVTKIFSVSNNICALGLMYGGIELPFAFKSFYDKEFEGRIKVAEVMGISFYGQDRGSVIMKQYSRDVLESAIPSAERLEDVIAPDDTAIIFDDNIMTGRTIELARDRLLTYGVKIPFAVCIRFPAENRIYHMKMKRHGGVDPFALGKDIKGLVAQSPYTRIFTSTGGYNGSIDARKDAHDAYKDVNGVFDLSRQRILKYLKKNGLQVQEDL
jgi:hydroxymethylpyrimidine pyrophosphatase-like HAD family hydrolase